METSSDVKIDETTYTSVSVSATAATSNLTASVTNVIPETLATHSFSAPTTPVTGRPSLTSPSKSSGDLTLLFGGTDKDSGLLGQFPATTTNADAPPSLASISSSSSGSSSSIKGIIHKKDMRLPHTHSPPGMSVAGSHLGKSRGKPSSVINVSLACPDTFTSSQNNSDGSRRRVSTAHTASAVIEKKSEAKAAAPPSESSWLGVLSMGYLGTVAEVEPEVKGEKYRETFCPPSTDAWNKLASARAAAMIEDSIVDLTVDMAVSITCEILKGKFNVPSSMPHDQISILLSMAVAEVFAEIGSSFSVGKDTVSWTRAIQSHLDLPAGFKDKSSARGRLDATGCPLTVLKYPAGMSPTAKISEASNGMDSLVIGRRSKASLHSLSAASALHGTAAPVIHEKQSNLHKTIPTVTSHAHLDMSHAHVVHTNGGNKSVSVSKIDLDVINQLDKDRNGSLIGGRPTGGKKSPVVAEDSY